MAFLLCLEGRLLVPRQTRRSVRGRQPYVEAFPALNALALARGYGSGHPCCQWTNERGLVVGHIEITALSEDEVTIRSQFLGAPNVGKHISKRRFGLRHNRVSVDYRRPNLVCPDCGQSARFLYMVASRWSCRKCHGLTLISQLLGNVTKYLRRVQELDVLLKRGRPRWGRKQAFAELEQEYWRLRKEFRDAPSLPEELRFAQYAEWLIADDPTLKLSIAPGEQGYGWKPRDSGGFLRLTWLADQELKAHGDAERATRGRPSASTVKPRILTGPVVREEPFAPGSVLDEPEPTRPKPFRFDPTALEGMTRDDE